ncbi:MAG: ABC transporter substrate-binding protein [Chloroflexota bacterium]
MNGRSSSGRLRTLSVAAAILGLVVAACGSGPAASSAASSAAASTVAASSSTAAGSAGASGGASASTAASPAASPSAAGYQGPPVTIEYAIWGDPQEITNQKKIVDAFHAKNPAITVNVTVADWDAYWDKLQTGLAGGAAPDVFAMDGPLFPDYQTRDVLLDLRPYIERDGYDLSQLAEQGVKDFTTPDGGQYGLPRDLNVIALYYNKKMFDAAGVAYPDDTWDWQKLVDTAKKLTKDTNKDGKPDQWGFYTETTDMENFWLSLVWENGGDVLGTDGKTTALGSPEAAGGIQFLQDLIYKDKVMADPAIFAETGDAFEQGKAAMEANGSWLVPTHTAAGIDFGVAPLPKGPTGRFTSVNPTGAVIAKSTKAPDAAWEFVKYLTGPDAQQQLMQLHQALPVAKTVLDGPFATAYPGADVFASALQYARLKPSFKGYNEFTTVLQGELDENVFNAPKKTAKEALGEIAPQLDALLAAG